MKKIAVLFSAVLLSCFFVYGFSPDLTGISKNPLKNSPLFMPDSQSYTFSTGIFSQGNSYQSYSLFSAEYLTSISKNLTLSYDVSYLNFDLKQNYMKGGIGLSYGNDNFRLSLYMNRIFDAKDYDILR
ncbi:MAG: hypothetical protein PHW02_08015 [bacterium]|nr:hypothetical protein [bacterium]